MDEAVSGDELMARLDAWANEKGSAAENRTWEVRGGPNSGVAWRTVTLRWVADRAGTRLQVAGFALSLEAASDFAMQKFNAARARWGAGKKEGD